jgi:hypothetical protein
MDFIEQLFGISPDAGSGVWEYCLIAVPFGFLILRGIIKPPSTGAMSRSLNAARKRFADRRPPMANIEDVSPRKSNTSTPSTNHSVIGRMLSIACSPDGGEIRFV